MFLELHLYSIRLESSRRVEFLVSGVFKGNSLKSSTRATTTSQYDILTIQGALEMQLALTRAVAAGVDVLRPLGILPTSNADGRPGVK